MDEGYRKSITSIIPEAADFYVAEEELDIVVAELVQSLGLDASELAKLEQANIINISSRNL